MRRLLLTTALLVVGCADRTHFDLRQTIYFAPENSFLADCEGRPDCSANRLNAVKQGIDQWFMHFDAASRPRAVIVDSGSEIPGDSSNRPIRLKISVNSSCDKYGNWAACYYWEQGEDSEITFRYSNYVNALTVAHEFGHAIWSDGHVLDRSSVMDPYTSFIVTPLDVIEMCTANGSCPPYDSVWCQGTFFYENLCPSDSPEDAKAKHLTQ